MPVYRLSVIIVSFNTKDELRQCLSSISPSHEIIVIDNASKDGSPEMVRSGFPQVRLITNETNLGFGTANNQGLAIATGEIVLFLNSDAVASEGAIERLVEVMHDSTVVACGGRLNHADGRAQWSCCSELTLWAVFCEQTYLERLFPHSPLFCSYWQTSRILESGTKSPVDVAQVMGACLMVRPLEKFDERFFLYCEDTELCKRLVRHGRIVYVPNAIFVHSLGASTRNRWKAISRYNRGKELYFAIHHGEVMSILCFVLNRLGALARALIWATACAVSLFLWKPARIHLWMFIKVLFAPVTGPARG